jgi:multidrug efflux pump subunit AcrA (membrane-fusion protein)
VTANAATSDASMGALERRREKALADVRLEEARLAALTLKAPLAGVITLGTNFRAGGPFAQREWRAGDQAWAGASIAQIPALDSLYILAKVDETDRGQLKTGLEADVEVQAVGGKPAPARITAFSALAKVDFGSIWPPPRLFDVQLDLGTPNPALRPGMTASIKIRRDKVPQALLVPTRGLFPPSGKTKAPGAEGTPAEVFVRVPGGFERRGVRVARRGPDKSAIAVGLQPGETIALILPEEILEP